MAEARTRVECDKTKSSGKEWAHLAKFEVLGIIDFCNFAKKSPTSTMHNFFNFELLEVFLDFQRVKIDIPCSSYKLCKKRCFC